MARVKKKSRKIFGISKAVFMISIMIVAQISFCVMLSGGVEAANTCCKKTKNGGSCQEVSQDQCAEGFVATSCSQASDCRIGCCYDAEGICEKNVPYKACIDNNGTWDGKADCSTPQCSQGCCIVSNKATLDTFTQCTKKAERAGLDLDFNEYVVDEFVCIAIAESRDHGACVFESGDLRTCRFISRETCSSMKGNFFKDKLCSATELNTICKKQESTRCVAGKPEVYWFDSCGNQENIYDSDKEKSWNNGNVLLAAESCNPGESNSNSKTCGNCNPILGTTCGKGNAEYGDYVCNDGSCRDSSGVIRKNGESWCAYDQQLGDESEAAGSAGSRHWKQYCEDGKVKVEPCADFRQDVCKADIMDFNGTRMSTAACIPNRWRECIGAGQGECSSNPDCYWFSTFKGTNLNLDTCLPRYPPGLKFWQSSSSFGMEAMDASEICGQGSAMCRVKWQKAGMFGSWKIVENAQCKESSFLNDLNKRCASLGDCGGKTNFMGVAGTDGFTLIDIDKDGNTNDWRGRVQTISSTYGSGGYMGSPGTGGGQAGKSGGEGGIGQAGSMGTMATAGITALGTLAMIGKGRFFWSVAQWSGQTGPLGALASALGYKESALTGAKAASKLGTGGATKLGTTVGKTIGVLGWAAAAYTVVSLILKIAGIPPEIAQSAAIAAGVGAGTGAALATFGSHATTMAHWAGSGLLTPGMASLAGLAIAVVVFLVMQFAGFGKQVKYETITYTCQAWQAPSGASAMGTCESANKDPMKMASEYRCKSLGAGCGLVNEGTNKEQCATTSKDDKTAPVITSIEVSPKEYSLDQRTITTQGGSMNAIRSSADASNRCVMPFTTLSINLQVNEPAQCKLDIAHTNKFSDMKFWVGGLNYYSMNHTHSIFVPPMLENGTEVAGPMFGSGGNYTLYFRCADANGNVNQNEYSISFCTDSSPDMSPPEVLRTSPDNGKTMPFGMRMINFTAFMNEPAECKWDTNDRQYSMMAHNATYCARSLEEYAIIGNTPYWPCTMDFTGLKDIGTNVFFVRCKDLPLEPEYKRNAMQSSYMFQVKGSGSELKISSLSPNGTIYGDVNLEATTDGGYGNSVCAFTENANYSDRMDFYETGSNNHKQTLYLTEGKYTEYVFCYDEAGNTARDKISFSVKVDKNAPKMARMYRDSSMLIIETDEDAECRYSTKNCNFAFEGGKEMASEGRSHGITDFMENETYSIQCKDIFGNRGCVGMIRAAFVNSTVNVQ